MKMMDTRFGMILLVPMLWLAVVPGLGNADEERGKKADTAYKVRVEVREVKNRIVEGRVRHHTICIDQPKQFGADDTAPTPPETLAFALGSCIVSTGRLVAIQKNLRVRAIEAVVESELDFAKALGMSQEKRAGFTGFKITVKIDAEMSSEDKRKLLQEIASRCPMCDNVQNPTPIGYELKD